MNTTPATRVWERVAQEQERADNASFFAERHEDIMAGGSGHHREFHQRMAAMHRQNERRHLAVADLHCSRALQRVLRAVERSSSVRCFTVMAEVAALVHARAAILTMVDTQSFQTLVLASDNLARRVQDMEFALGQGPVRDVLLRRGPVEAGGQDMAGRWHDYAREVQALGYGSVAAVPLDRQGILTGAVVLLDPERPLQEQRKSVAHVGNVLVRVLTANPSASPTGSRPVSTRTAEAVALRYGGSIDDAITMIRARAFTERRPVGKVVRAILDRGRAPTR